MAQTQVVSKIDTMKLAVALSTAITVAVVCGFGISFSRNGVSVFTKPCQSVGFMEQLPCVWSNVTTFFSINECPGYSEIYYKQYKLNVTSAVFRNFVNLACTKADIGLSCYVYANSVLQHFSPYMCKVICKMYA